MAPQKWSLTSEAFDGLLSALDPNRELAGERYLELRRNLVQLFEWRGCPAPDEYADEALNRCARKIAQGEVIRDLATYAIGIGRMLAREMARDHAMAEFPLEHTREPSAPPITPDDDAGRVNCLRRCLSELPVESRRLILGYYTGDKSEKIKNRKRLTDIFGIPSAALRMRALRLRERLQLCSDDCLRQRRGDSL